MSPAEAVAERPRSVMVDKILEHHPDRFEMNESHLAAVLCGRTDSVKHQSALGFSVYGLLGPLGRMMEQALGENEVAVRRRQVNLLLHRKGLDMVELPKTKIGYVLGVTDRRLLVFNANAKKFVTESPLREMRLERLEHSDGKISLFLCEGRSAVALTSWEDDDVTDHFVETFHELQVAAFARRR